MSAIGQSMLCDKLFVVSPCLFHSFLRFAIKPKLPSAPKSSFLRHISSVCQFLTGLSHPSVIFPSSFNIKVLFQYKSSIQTATWRADLIINAKPNIKEMQRRNEIEHFV